VSALAVSLSPTSVFVLRKLLAQIDATDTDLHQVDGCIRELLRPYALDVELLRTFPGLDDVSIATIFAETGPDMTVFPTADKLGAWAGLSPGSRESAGKSKPAAMRGRSASRRRGRTHSRCRGCSSRRQHPIWRTSRKSDRTRFCSSRWYLGGCS
jgi:transposase